MIEENLLARWLSFSRRQLLIAAFIASLPAGLFLAALNYRSARSSRLFWLLLLAAFFSAILLVAVFIWLPSSPVDKLFPFISVLLMVAVSKGLAVFKGSIGSWVVSVTFAFIILAAEFFLASFMLPYLTN